MPANPEIASVATPPPGADLDEFLRALKGSGNPTPPAQQADQLGSSLSNTHQGQSAPAHETDSGHVVARGEREQSGHAGGSDKGDDAGPSELSPVRQIPVEDVVVARTSQDGLA